MRPSDASYDTRIVFSFLGIYQQVNGPATLTKLQSSQWRILSCVSTGSFFGKLQQRLRYIRYRVRLPFHPIFFTNVNLILDIFENIALLTKMFLICTSRYRTLIMYHLSQKNRTTIFLCVFDFRPSNSKTTLLPIE